MLEHAPWLFSTEPRAPNPEPRTPNPQPPAPNPQPPAPSTQHRVLSIQHSAFSTHEMHSDLQHLIRLQDLELVAERVRQRVVDLPLAQASLDARIAERTAAVEAMKARLA